MLLVTVKDFLCFQPGHGESDCSCYTEQWSVKSGQCLCHLLISHITHYLATKTCPLHLLSCAVLCCILKNILGGYRCMSVSFILTVQPHEQHLLSCCETWLLYLSLGGGVLMPSTHAPRMSFPFLKAISPTKGHLNNAEYDGLRGKGGTVFQFRACLLHCNAKKNFLPTCVFLLFKALFPSSLQAEMNNFYLFPVQINKHIWEYLKCVYMLKTCTFCLKFVEICTQNQCDNDFFKDLALTWELFNIVYHITVCWSIKGERQFHVPVVFFIQVLRTAKKSCIKATLAPKQSSNNAKLPQVISVSLGWMCGIRK